MVFPLAFSLFGGEKRPELDDGSWLPSVETHEPPEASVPFDLAVQARLRREREAAGADPDAELCLGPEPMRTGTRLLLTLPFVVGGWALLAWAVRGLIRGFSVFDLIVALVGLGTGLIATHVLFGTFNPRLSLLCDRASFVPGEPATIRWRFSSPPRRARSLRIDLVAREEATYRQGTSDTTAAETVYEETRVRVEARNGSLPPEGTFDLALPAEAMHSFRSDNNAYTWTLSARADIRLWPDVKHTASLQVWAGALPEPAMERRA